MNINTVKLAATRFGGRGVLLTKKYSPQILTTVGILGGITSAVMASKATLKLERGAVLDDLEMNMQDIKDLRSVGKEVPTKDVAFLYTTATIQIAKLYAPAVSLGAASIVCIISAQGIMQKRNAALTAAYVAVEKGFSEYRKKVQEVLGEDKERELNYDIKKERVDDTQKGTSEEVEVAHSTGHSQYARFFDEGSRNWTRDANYNRTFLSAQERFANDKLVAQGYLFLNDIYDALDIPRSPAGQLVGWIYKPNDDSRDSFVSFGMYDGDSPEKRNFINGVEKSILLDFNVDGVIYDQI